MSWNKIKGGILAKRVGADFEKRFFHYCMNESDVSIIRIQDGCMRVSANKLIQMRQVCDWIVFYKDRILLIDTKSTKTSAYPLIEDKIFFQLQEMGKASKHGQKAGYFLEFREICEFRYFSIEVIRKILLTRKSLVPSDGVLVGTSFPMFIDFGLILNS